MVAKLLCWWYVCGIAAVTGLIGFVVMGICLYDRVRGFFVCWLVLRVVLVFLLVDFVSCCVFELVLGVVLCGVVLWW